MKLEISGREAFPIALCLMIPYLPPFYLYARYSNWWIPLMLLYFSGVFLLSFRIIPAGKRGQLTFGATLLNKFWKNGFYVVPTFLPMLKNIDINLLWGVLIEGEDDTHHHQGVVVDHHADQRLPRFNVNTVTSLFKMLMVQKVSNVADWYFTVHKGAKSLLYQRVGLRVMIAAIFFATIANIVTWVEKSLASFVSPNNYSVLVQLTGTYTPLAPRRNDFSLRADASGDSFLNSRGELVLLYPDVPDGVTPIIKITSRSCMPIPPGKAVMFDSAIVPQFAGNMKGDVNYYPKEEYISIWGKLRRIVARQKFGDSYVYEDSDSWNYIRNHWNEVEKSRIAFRAQALTTKESESDMPGGLVCF